MNKFERRVHSLTRKMESEIIANDPNWMTIEQYNKQVFKLSDEECDIRLREHAVSSGKLTYEQVKELAKTSRIFQGEVDGKCPAKEIYNKAHVQALKQLNYKPKGKRQQERKSK